ncbi:MAG: SDR family oxidoreductase [Bacteroidetes bacterium]|nr:MAG: SDR family oxidoreductase [Bacteroidota bacterium]
MNIVITGASRGLGKAIAEAFAQQGPHFFWLTGRRTDTLTATEQALQQAFPAAQFCSFAADLGTTAGCQSLANWVLSYQRPIDVLINNAGSFEPGSVHSEPEGQLETMLNTNLMSAYHLTRALLPPMVARQQGHIFNMCSIASQQAYANGGSYSISKFALLGFGKNLREELKPHQIKVTNVLPGAAYTDSWAASGIDENRLMAAADVAQMVVAAAQLSPRACVEELVLRPQLGDL